LPQKFIAKRKEHTREESRLVQASLDADTGPMIARRDPNDGPFGLRAHDHETVLGRTFAHDIEGVHEAIEGGLLRLDPVAPDGWKAWADFGRDPLMTVSTSM
jgi:hypothetical protein